MFATHSCPGSGQKICAIDEDFDETATTEAFVTNGDGSKKTGSIEPFVLPKYKEQKQSEIYLSAATMNLRRQLIALQAKMTDSRFDFVLKPEGFIPKKDGNITKDIHSLLKLWMGEKPLSVFDVSEVPSNILHDIIGILLRVMTLCSGPAILNKEAENVLYWW